MPERHQEHEHEQRERAVLGWDTKDVVEHERAHPERGAKRQHHRGDEQERGEQGTQQQCQDAEND